MKVKDIDRSMDVYSPWKTLWHMKDIEAVKKGNLFPPKNIQLDLEGWCPHDCKFCSYRNANFEKVGMQFFKKEWADMDKIKFGQQGVPKGKLIPEVSGMKKEIALSLPKQFHEAGVKSVEITGGGESLAYPYISEFFDELAKYDIELAVVTNGHLFTPKLQDKIKKMRWLRFSVDAATSLTYSKVHGIPGSVFEYVIKQIKNCIGRWQGCRLGISYIIVPENVNEIAQAAKFFKEMGVDNIRFSFCYDSSDYGGGRLTKEQRREAEMQLIEAKKIEDHTFKVFGSIQRLSHYAIGNTDFNFCGYMLFTWSIGYDGLVYPCCIVKYHPEFAFGDLKKNTLKEIVHSKERREYMDKFDVRKCKPCWLRDKNKFIEYLFADNPEHINFP